MAVVADTGGLLALYDADDPLHEAAKAVGAAEPRPLRVPAAVLGELGYLLRTCLGPDAAVAFLDDIAAGVFLVEPFLAVDALRARALLARYRDLDLGLVDAAVMATADRLGTRRILTVDERDFRAVLSASGQPFVLLPADA